MAEADDNTGISPEVEVQARELGWAPQDEFKGDPEKWVDAKTYVDRGEHVLPIVKATNRRLRDDLTRQSTELAKVQTALRESQETINALQEFHQEDVKHKVENARKNLLEQIKQAKKDENIDLEVDLTDELSRLNAASSAAGEEATPKKGNGEATPAAPAAIDHTKDPVFIAWQEDNPWFGDDQARTSIAQGVAARLRRSDPELNVKGRAFLDKVTEGVNKEITRLTGRPAPSKVESGRSSASTSSNSKSYADLPPEAKDACDKYARDARIVGPNKIYKDEAAWRKYYTETYFS